VSEEKGIPIASEAFRCPDCGKYESTDEDVLNHIATTHPDKTLVPVAVELVDLEDVEDLIKEKIENQDSASMAVDESKKAALREVLDEVKGSSELR